MDTSTPSNRDPKDQIDPANPPPEHEVPSAGGAEPDQDAEATMNAPDEARPDGLRTDPPTRRHESGTA